MSAVADKLREARALIERGWCQGSFTARMASALCYCTYGAINQAVTGVADADVEATIPCEVLVARAVGTSPVGLATWNDEPERTQADVIAAFDKAIELAEQSDRSELLNQVQR